MESFISTRLFFKKGERGCYIADNDAFEPETQIKPAHKPDYIVLPNAALQNPAENPAGKYIHDGMLIIPPAFSMYSDIFDV